VDAVGPQGSFSHSTFVEPVAIEGERMSENTGGRGDILIVDDGPEDLRVLCELLRSEGYLTRPVSDPTMALAAAAAEPPDLILLDIMMPGMDGFEVCRRLKRDARLRDIPVVFLSAIDDVAENV
jgi:CheY-like chemotaxis protein